jgi:hypothetical protein
MIPSVVVVTQSRDSQQRPFCIRHDHSDGLSNLVRGSIGWNTEAPKARMHVAQARDEHIQTLIRLTRHLHR